MDVEFLLKAIPVVVGVVGGGKLLYDLMIGKRGRMRDEFKFASDFLGALENNPAMHPYLKEKGYQAIAGDGTLDAEVIEYLLSLKNPDRALKDYVLARQYLEHLSSGGDLKIEYREKYRTAWSRNWRIAIFGFFYALFALAAFSPFMFAAFLPVKNTQVFPAMLITIVIFGPYAWMSLKAGTRIYRARMLVDHQHKHTQKIVIHSGFKSSRRAVVSVHNDPGE